jgi:hypothetical protein
MKGAKYTPPDEPVVAEEKPQAVKQRARSKKGTFQGDDPGTPDVNEAWEEPKE